MSIILIDKCQSKNFVGGQFSCGRGWSGYNFIINYSLTFHPFGAILLPPGHCGCPMLQQLVVGGGSFYSRRTVIIVKNFGNFLYLKKSQIKTCLNSSHTNNHYFCNQILQLINHSAPLIKFSKEYHSKTHNTEDRGWRRCPCCSRACVRYIRPTSSLSARRLTDWRLGLAAVTNAAQGSRKSKRCRTASETSWYSIWRHDRWVEPVAPPLTSAHITAPTILGNLRPSNVM